MHSTGCSAYSSSQYSTVLKIIRAVNVRRQVPRSHSCCGIIVTMSGPLASAHLLWYRVFLGDISPKGFPPP